MQNQIIVFQWNKEWGDFTTWSPRGRVIMLLSVSNNCLHSSVMLVFISQDLEKIIFILGYLYHLQKQKGNLKLGQIITNVLSHAWGHPPFYPSLSLGNCVSGNCCLRNGSWCRRDCWITSSGLGFIRVGQIGTLWFDLLQLCPCLDHVLFEPHLCCWQIFNWQRMANI